MEVNKYVIRRSNPDVSWSIPCSGATNMWPINYSTNCSGSTMYSSTASQVLNALNGNMNNFPMELSDCSPTNPCVILWDVNPQPIGTVGRCQVNDFAYIEYKGFWLTTPGPVTQQVSYSELIGYYESNNFDLSTSLQSQSSSYAQMNRAWCLCDNPLGEFLYDITFSLHQDFNDIGHYSLWDGNIDQKEIFQNFVVSATTNPGGIYDGYYIQVWNTTDFGFYKTFQDSAYVIDWGDGTQSTLQYPTLIGNHQYAATAVPTYKQIKITYNAPWGPVSTTKTIVVPNLDLLGIVSQPPGPSPLLGGMPPQQVNLTGPTNTGGLPVGSSTAGHAVYGNPGTMSYMPLDSAVDINEFSGLSPMPCFTVTGITESILGSFQTYSNTTNAPGLLEPGMNISNTPGQYVVPIGGDVIDPVSNEPTPGLMGEITAANGGYTAYTVYAPTVAGNITPIEYYDFVNGITIFVAESCGLPGNTFLDSADCFQCEIDDCTYCETKDEYFNRESGVLGGPTAISVGTNYANLVPPQQWNSFTNYNIGDIVFDRTYNLCCCYMVVKDIIQSGATPSDWAGVPPAITDDGMWYPGLDINGNTLPGHHIYEPCCRQPDCDCGTCPPGTATPCNDPTNPWNSYPLTLPVGPAGPWVNGNVYNAGEFTEGPNGGCYRALSTGAHPSPVTGAGASTYWDYVTCASWACPIDPTATGCQMYTGLTQGIPGAFPFYSDCDTFFAAGECFDTQWICEDQYNCSGCIEINSSHSGYTLPIAPPVFSAQAECEAWCDPPLYSCATPTTSPCCLFMSCDILPNLYTAAMNDYFTAFGGGAPITIPNLNSLDLYLDSSICESACCETLGYQWTCTYGCQEFPGLTQSLADCVATSPAGTFGLSAECGYDCVNPCVPYVPGVSSPCMSCTDLGIFNTPGCAPFQTDAQCAQSCTADTSCYRCDCYDTQPCTLEYPCTTPSATVPGCTGPNPALGTYATASACTASCICDAGWDCYIINNPYDPNYGQPDGQGCRYVQDLNLLGTGFTFSSNGPFSALTDCCLDTGCCTVNCDEIDALYYDPAINGYTPANYIGPPNPPPPFGTGTYPCYYETVSNTSIGCYSGQSGGPYNAGFSLPFCTMADCLNWITADAPCPPAEDPLGNPTGFTCCEEEIEITCDCACSGTTAALMISPLPLNHTGAFVASGTEGYTIGDTVTYVDIDSPVCCYVCNCPDNGGVLDCNSYTPDMPLPPGQINCWESCGSTEGSAPSGCTPCLGYSATQDTYLCTTNNGCVASDDIILNPGGMGVPCVINPLFTQTQQNCYTSSTCDYECQAGCYCDDQGTPNPLDDITGCVMLQDVLNGLTPFASTNYFALSLDSCNTAITLGMDCCTGETFYCDYIDNGSVINCDSTGTLGTGCQSIYDGQPGYPGPYTSLTDCQQACTWECDSNGWQQCQFVLNSTAPVTFPSANACYVANTQPTNCYCQPSATTSWYCDNSGQSGLLPGTSNCVTSTVVAGYTTAQQQQVYGQGQITYFAGGTGFLNQTFCEEFCRYKCYDTNVGLTPPNTPCECSLDWGNNGGTTTSFYDCTGSTFSNLGYYPCCPTGTTIFCCDPILGCLGPYTPGNQPAGCLGTFSSDAQCNTECNFACGDCFGTDNCFCEFYFGPLVCTGETIYNTMADCQANYTLGQFSSTGCCDCYDCAINGGITWTYTPSDNATTWMSNSTSVPSPQNGILGDPWSSGQVGVPNGGYFAGDTVLYTNSDGVTCCYVFVNKWNTSWIDFTIDPHTYYTSYVNAVANNDFYLAYYSQVWIACDPSCAPPSIITWDCFPGTATDTCLNLTNFFQNSVGNPVPYFGDALDAVLTGWGNPNVTNSGFQAAVFQMGQYVTELMAPFAPQTPGHCQGPNGGYLHKVTGINVSGVATNPSAPAYLPTVAAGTPFSSWKGLIDALNADNWMLGNGTSPIWNVTDPLVVYNDFCIYNEGDCFGAKSIACICGGKPCDCQPVYGPGGQYATSASCYSACCETSYRCHGTLCQCIDCGGPQWQTGCAYANLGQCQNDPLTCCSSATTEWSCYNNGVTCECIQAPGPYSSLTHCQTANNCCKPPDPTDCTDCHAFSALNDCGQYFVLKDINQWMLTAYGGLYSALTTPLGVNLHCDPNYYLYDPATQCCWICVMDKDGTLAGNRNFLGEDPNQSACCTIWKGQLWGSSLAMGNGCWCQADQKFYDSGWIPCGGSGQNCLPPNYEETWDCDMQTQTCYDPLNGSGQYHAGNGGYLACVQNCISHGNCKDCENALSPFLDAPGTITMMGPWDPAQSYSHNDCVTIQHHFGPMPLHDDPECCYCCVRKSGGPDPQDDDDVLHGLTHNLDNYYRLLTQQSNKSLKSVDASFDDVVLSDPDDPFNCPIGFDPSQGGSMNGSQWLPCGIQPNGDPCVKKCKKCCCKGNQQIQLASTTNPCVCPQGWNDCSCNIIIGPGGPVGIEPSDG